MNTRRSPFLKAVRFLITMLLILAAQTFTAYAHTADGVSFQSAAGTPVMYTSGVSQSAIDMAVREYNMLPDSVKQKMSRYNVLIYLYPSYMEADPVDPGFIAVTHSGVWAWAGSMSVIPVTPPWIDVHSDRMNAGTVVHEAGHIADHLYEPGVTAGASRTEEFQALYQRYRNAVAQIDASTAGNSYIPEEVYAECFRLCITNPSALRAVSQELCDYVSRTADLNGSGYGGSSPSAAAGGSAEYPGSGEYPGSSVPPAAEISYGTVQPSSAWSGWQQDCGGWWYLNDDGSYPANDWLCLNGSWYFFDPDGYMARGWRYLGGRFFFLDPYTGEMWYNAVTPDWHILGPDGALIF